MAKHRMKWDDKVILVTGGTGSFGKKLIEILLAEYLPAKVIVFSRDELKQHEMRVSGFDHPNLRYFIGDVRDQGRLRRAMHGVDIVIHAAALKQVFAFCMHLRSLALSALRYVNPFQQEVRQWIIWHQFSGFA